MKYEDMATIASAWPGLFRYKDLLNMEVGEFILWLNWTK